MRNIFISVGSAFTPDKSAFLDKLIAVIRSCDAMPRVIGKTDVLVESPLSQISKVMSECDGVIVVAYERIYISSGVEKRGGDKPERLKDAKLTTPWNHIEAALAFNQGLPILVLAENGLRHEGLIDYGFNWCVDYIDIDPASLDGGETNARIQKFCREANRGTKEKIAKYVDELMTIGELIRSLRLKALAQVLVILSVIFSTGCVVGAYFRTDTPWPSLRTPQAPAESGKEVGAVANSSAVPQTYDEPFLISNEVGRRWAEKFSAEGTYSIKNNKISGVISKLRIHSTRDDVLYRVSIGACHIIGSGGEWDVHTSQNGERARQSIQLSKRVKKDEDVDVSNIQFSINVPSDLYKYRPWLCAELWLETEVNGDLVAASIPGHSIDRKLIKFD